MPVLGPDHHVPDPFTSPTTPSKSNNDGPRQRYGGFDSTAFSMFATGSPAQAKRALEAHIAETERKLQQTSQLGQTLVSQRKELADRLKEVESQQDEEVNPALKARLLELENEFNHVNRETARIFVGKNRVPSGEAPERDVIEYGGVAHPSPSKAHAPSRKQRNQQPSRVNDLQLATDISAELLEQVRILQASLAEKDALLKEVTAEKTQLEADLEVTRQRVKALDESEQRYKDENWALETQLHELTAEHKDATSREQRLTQTLAVATSSKAALEREYEDLRQTHSKLTDEHTAIRKQHEAEMVNLKKNATQDETQITGLHKKVEELTSQNKELAQAFAYRLGEQSRQVSGESAFSGEGIPDDEHTPDDSPPGSPSKATPRHGALHEETTKSALNHAYRTIQNLKNQLHREKTEKMDYRRLLQEARDDLESKRNGVDSGKKRKPTKDQELFKKPSRPDRLGEARNSKEEIVLDEDEDWEDHDPADTPSKRRTAVLTTDGGADKRASMLEHSTDAYATATENSDAAFETANEREATGTESEAFQTGAETLDGDSDLTETETSIARGRTGKRPGHAHRMSFQSTASTSADEFDDENEVKTPIQPSQPGKYKIRVNRGGPRRMSERETGIGASRSSEDSPGNISSNNSTPMGQGQSLFAELGELSDAETEEGTPTSSKILSPITSPDLRRLSPAPSKLRESAISTEPIAPKPVMVDAGIMTEPWEPETKSALANAADVVGAAAAGAAGFVLGKASASDEEAVTRVPQPEVEQKSLVTQHLAPSVGPSQSTEPVTPVLTDFPQPPAHTATSVIASQASEPIEATKTASPAPALSQSAVLSEHTPSVEPPKIVVPTLAHSPVYSEQTSPVEPVTAKSIEVPPQVLSFSSTIHQDTVPVDAIPPRPSTATKITEAAAAGAGAGFLGSLLGRKKSPEPTTIAEDETSQPVPTKSETRDMATGTSTERLPLRQIEANAPPSPERKPVKDGKPVPMAIAIQTTNEATQTALSADDLDRLLRPAPAIEAAGPKVLASPTRASFGSSSPRRSRDLSTTQDRTQRRPGSAGSHRSRDRSPAPPLPPQAKETIERANALSGKPPSSSHSATAPVAAFGGMPPPLFPASANRASTQVIAQRPPRTPQGSQPSIVSQSPVRHTVTIAAPPRPGTASRSQVASPTTTRRSSVSSFASELDQRFNISAAGPYDGMFNDGQATDPRMIQAITNTMIGEYLYKYTRKAGSKEMSSTRHRRFFWVHPYTRTLYWSEQDPTTAGKQQLKAKSVQIESVRIVTDDNPMPPGLHRKSLVVTTPGRTIKFTAPTSQRHETWSNALTYLLLKTGTERDVESAGVEDSEEFNPTLGGARSTSRATGRSRASISSYMSRRTASPQRQQHPTLRASSAQGIRSHSQNRASLSNRLSAIAGSIASRHSKYSVAQEPELEAHNPNDSAEDLRKVIEQQERDADRLENVRACCDGESDSDDGNGRQDLVVLSFLCSLVPSRTGAQPRLVYSKSTHDVDS
jgi:predicted  nucleic acid-binding Zn-ribbon protein